MRNVDEILEILEEIKRDMGGVAAGKLKKPEISGIEIEARPMGEEEAKDALEDAMVADDDIGSRAIDTEQEMGTLEDVVGGEMDEEEEEEEEILPRWKQRMKKGM